MFIYYKTKIYNFNIILSKYIVLNINYKKYLKYHKVHRLLLLRSRLVLIFFLLENSLCFIINVNGKFVVVPPFKSRVFSSSSIQNLYIGEDYIQ